MPFRETAIKSIRAFGVRIADIVKPGGSRTPSSAGGGLSRNGKHTCHNVIDMGEIPLHLAVIEYRDRLSGHDFPRERIGRHIGPPPWASYTVKKRKPVAGILYRCA